MSNTASPSDAAVPARKPRKPRDTTNEIFVPKGSIARSVVPGHVFRQTAFKWEPQAFAVEHDKFDGKLVTEKPQADSLAGFRADTRFKGIFAVAGNPDDVKAKYFAAYLTHLHMTAGFAHSHVIWEPIYGGFDNRLMRNPESPTMLVLYNLTPEATATKLEKARDLLEYYSDIPRVIVLAGGDPVSFICGRLHVPLNAFVYIQGQVLNTVVI